MTSGERHPTGGLTAPQGYAYLMLLLLIAGASTIAAHSLELGASIHRRAAERELLRVGAEFERALQSYVAAVPGTDPTLAGPVTLQDLLKDERQPQARRHLRKLYNDPLTGKNQWGLVHGPGGTIWGVHSLAIGQPLQQKRFPASTAHFEDASSYAEWVFGLPQARAQQPAQTAHSTKSPGLLSTARLRVATSP